MGDNKVPPFSEQLLRAANMPMVVENVRSRGVDVLRAPAAKDETYAEALCRMAKGRNKASLHRNKIMASIKP